MNTMNPTTKDFSVKFGRNQDQGLEGQKTFPFLYTFINHNDSKWDEPYNIIGDYSASLDNIVNGIGPLVPAGQKVSLNILLDPDCNYKLLTIRYTACYQYYKGDPDFSYEYRWFFDQNMTAGAGGLSEGPDFDTDKIGTPVYKYINMSVSFQGSGSQMLYGGDDAGPFGNGRLPIPVEVLEGYPDCGILSVRTPRLLPMQGSIVFDVYNTHPTQDIVVGAMVYGMKVRL